MRAFAFVMVVVVMAACGSAAIGTPTPTAATASPPTSGDCSWTKPRNATPPPLPVTRTDQNEAFTRSGVPLFMHFNDSLAVRLPTDGTFVIGPGEDGVKLGWIRLKDGPLTASAQRLDVPETVRVDIADNYGPSGLQITGVRFRAAGCYSVTASVAGGTPLTFVARVALR